MPRPVFRPFPRGVGEGRILRVLAVFFVCAATPSFAYAYLDPGSGSIFLQLLLGGVASVAVAGRLFWHRLRQRFGGGRKPEGESSHDATPSAQRDSPSPADRAEQERSL
jgi:hypothetical protein